MPCDGNDIELLHAAMDGSTRRAKAALEAGASVNGYPDQLPFTPIVAAIVDNHAGMVSFLLEQGADPDRPVTREVQCPTLGLAPKTMLGERALAIAARSGKVEIVRLLLHGGRADPNAPNSVGDTPLMVTCKSPDTLVEVVRLLLEAGADPALAEEDGFIPLHMVALNDHMDLVDMLHSRAPATLNRCADMGQTPLFGACGAGHGGMVSKLLSLGAMERLPLDESSMFPLEAAVISGSAGAVRVMINEGGIRAVGGDEPLGGAMLKAVEFRQARILRLLLTADGEEGRWGWANINIGGSHLLHFGAGYCYPAAVSALLEAGADEAARDLEGFIPRDVIGLYWHLQLDKPQMDRGKEVAVRRMLQRGPAYRARSWAWPSDEEAGAGGSGGGDTAAASATLSSPPAVPQTPPVVGVRKFRPKERSSSKFFVRLIGRYCAKD